MRRSHLLSAVTALSLIAGLVVGLPPTPVVAIEPETPRDRSVPVQDLVEKAQQDNSLPAAPSIPVVWPVPGSAVVELPLTKNGLSRKAGVASPGGLPVRISPAVAVAGDVLSQQALHLLRQAPADTPSRVEVKVLGRDAAQRAGVALGLQVKAAPATRGGRARLEVDYSEFRNAYGGDWSARLRLAVLPECALLTPQAAGCSPKPLPTTNDFNAHTLSADVDVPSTWSAGSEQTAKASSGESSVSEVEPLTVALMSEPGSADSGDFSKTDMTESAGWSAGLQSGDFSYSYPLGVPPVPGGLTPELALAYSSGSVDGQTGGRHTQPSTIGEGWSYSPGFIERTYRPCSDDTANSPHWPQLNLFGDLCWRLPNAQIMWNGRSQQIILGGDGVWRLEDDNGERVELLTGAGNNDNDGEHWRITTLDGTQYWFGKGTSSVMTAPVYANHAGEPCFSSSSYTSSKCWNQGVRWGLDYVVDRNGNEMTFSYSRTTNRTALLGDPNVTTSYHRDMRVYQIDYGTNIADGSGGTAPARVRFSYADRCLTTTCTTKDGNNWPDTPWDLQCNAAPCNDNRTPSFWSDRRMAAIYTQVQVAGIYSTVDYWSLEHQFPDTGDGSHAVLWLSKINRAGKAGDGADTYLPAVTFWGTRKQNRADYDPAAGMRSHNKWRVYKILTETGRQIEVTYAGDGLHCAPGDTPDPDNNHYRCFPQYYVPETAPAGWSWWHKRIVTKVVETDATGTSTAPITHEYAYSNAATDNTVLWGYDTGARVWGSSTFSRSWSDWRGYTNVIVKTGDPAGTRSQVEYVYFRGLHGDRTDSGTRTVGLTPYNGTWTDQAQRRGHLMNKYIYDRAGGQVVEVWQYNPYTQVTGTRTESSSWAIPGTFKSQINRVGSWDQWLLTPSGSLQPQKGQADTFDNYGRLTTRYDKGAVGVVDETCTTFGYVGDIAKHLLAFQSRQRTFTGTCDGNYPEADLIADHAWRFDGGVYGAAPTKGNVTKDYVHNGVAWMDRAANVVYDAYGRVTSADDGIGRRTVTAYTQNSDRLTSQVTVTNAADHVVTTTLDVNRGLPLSITDPNGKVTTATYDTMGRLLSVKRPGNSTAYPDAEFYYYVSQTHRSYVRTRTLGPNGHQINSYEIFDGFARPRQSQVVAPDWKRVITDTQYDSRGLVAKTSQFYNADSGPSSNLAVFNDADVPTQTRFTYDGQNRETFAKLYSLNTYKWQTKTVYGYKTTGVIPPSGGTTTMDVVDGLGQVIEKRQYHTADLTGAFDKTAYAYNRRGELEKVTDPAGNSWTYGYDLAGRKKTATDPDAGTTNYTYDHASQMQTSTDARGIVLDYNYDSLGRKTSIYQGATRLSSWSYDTIAKGQMYAQYSWNDGLAYNSYVLALDDAYRPTKIRTKIPASTGNGTLAGDYDTTMSYNVNGSLASQTLPGVGGLPAETLTYTYVNQGFPDTMTGSWTGGSQTYIADTQHTYDGLVSEQLLGTAGKRVKLTNIHDEATRRIYSADIAVESSSNVYSSKSRNTYAFDAAGNIKTLVGRTNGIEDQVECFSYDYLRRLVEAWTEAVWDCSPPTPQPGGEGADPYWRKWTFDKIGNRLTQVDKGSTSDTTWTYQVGAAGGVKPHQLKQVTSTGLQAGPTRTFEYDAAGNMTSRTTESGTTQTLTWDPLGQLADIAEGSAATSYVYGADGSRLISRAPDKTTLYLPDGTELELTAGGGPVLGTRHYGSTAVRDATGLRWVAADQNGTSIVQIDAVTLASQKRRKMPYGEDRGAQPTGWMGTKGYVGGTKDQTGLTHLGAREYDPTLGRFISVDPIMDLRDPQQWHGYAYASNTPVTLRDPSGLYNDPGYGEGGGDSTPPPPVVTCPGHPSCPPPPSPPAGPPCGSCNVGGPPPGPGRPEPAPGEPSTDEPTGASGSTSTPTAPAPAPNPSGVGGVVNDIGSVLAMIAEYGSYIPGWICQVCAGIVAAIGVLAGLLLIFTGDIAKGIATILSAGLGVFLGKAGQAIAKRIAKEVTPSLLYDLGMKAWNFIEVGSRHMTSLRWFPSRLANRVNDFVSDAAHGVSQWLASFTGRVTENALSSS